MPRWSVTMVRCLISLSHGARSRLDGWLPSFACRPRRVLGAWTVAGAGCGSGAVAGGQPSGLPAGAVPAGALGLS